MTEDAFPRITTDMIDTDEAELPFAEDVGQQLYDLRFLDALCRATGRDTLEYVRGLLAIMHADDEEAH